MERYKEIIIKKDVIPPSVSEEVLLGIPIGRSPMVANAIKRLL
jgi:hypothetical protein